MYMDSIQLEVYKAKVNEKGKRKVLFFFIKVITTTAYAWQGQGKSVKYGGEKEEKSERICQAYETGIFN